MRDLFTFFASRTPNAARPGVACDGNSDREVCSVFSIATRAGEPRANGQFAVDHPGCGVRNSIGNTTGTSRADPPDESNPFGAIPTTVAKRLLQND